MESYLTSSFLLSLLQIVWIDIILSGDNAVVIAMACRGLPERQRRIEPRRRLDRSTSAAPNRVAHQLDHIDRPGGLDEGERRHGCQLEPTPRPSRAGAVALGLIRRFRAARNAGDAGIEQYRQPLLDDVGCEAPMRGGQPEEAGEAERLNVRIGSFHSAAERLRTDVDAEGGLDRGCGR